ncbi:MAG TPA: hypothetical protein VIS07_18745 [Candidatus Binatia bacterium]
MTQKPIIESHPTEFFRELVQEAMHSQGLTSQEETEFYLVQLLEQHLRMRGDLLSKPLALTYLEAANAGGVERFHGMKLVGDTALFILGLFADCLERTLVQPVYYVSLGQLAYRRVADVGSPTVREMFENLAAQFTDLVRVLGEISTRELFSSDRDTLRIYRRWLLTRGAVDASLLVRRGIIPSEPSKAHH